MSRTMKRVCRISLIVAGAGLILAVAMYFAGASVAARFTADGLELAGGPPDSPELKLVAQSELDAISALNIRVDSAEIEVVQGDRYALELWSYESGGQSQLRYQMDGGSLSVWDVRRGRSGGWQVQFGFNFPQGWTNPGNNRVVITLPADAELETADLNGAFGSIDAQGIRAGRLGVTLSYGPVTLSDTSAETVNIRLSSSDLTVDGIEAGELSVRNSFGQVRVQGAAGRFSSVSVEGDSCDVDLRDFGADRLDIRDNFGTVRLEGLVLDALKVEGDSCDLIFDRVSAADAQISDNFGAVTATAWSSGSLRLNTDSCEIDIEGSLRGRTGIDSSFGAVTLRSGLPRGEYSIDIEADFGGVSIDGVSAGGEYRDSADDRPHQIEVNLSYGDVVLRFGS